MSERDPSAKELDDDLATHQRDIVGIVRAGLIVVGAGLVPALAWLTFAPLVSAVVAPAFVKVDLNRLPVQHAEGGMIAEVRVRDGQRVTRGEPMIVLGDVSVAADMNRLTFRVLAEQASVARLEAEQALGGGIIFAEEMTRAAAADVRLAAHLTKERSLFSARRDAMHGQSLLLRTQRGRIDQEMVALRAQIAQAARSLAHQTEEIETNRNLLRDGFVSSTRISQLEAAVADYSVKLEEKRSDLARAEQRVVETDLRIKGLESEYRQQASDQLKVTAQRLSELQQEHRKTIDAAARQIIAAPADGEVMGLRFTSPGAVIPPREPIADIVPLAPKLLLEAQIRPEDIEHVRQGQTADLRFTAFNPRTTPAVEGKVVYVSADRFVDRNSNQPYYLAHVEADVRSLQRAGDLKLQAGMPAEVYVRGQTRTAMQYLIEPITEVLRRGAREH